MHLLGRISPAPLPLFFSPFILCVFSTEDPCPHPAALSFSQLCPPQLLQERLAGV